MVAEDVHKVYLADSGGRLFLVENDGRKITKVAQADLKPITCLTATRDGRVFGFYGKGMANLFLYSPRSRTIRNLGVAISVLNRRRYGYEFATATTGKDGEIYFGEKDRKGHLWVYFPSIQNHKSKPV